MLSSELKDWRKFYTTGYADVYIDGVLHRPTPEEILKDAERNKAFEEALFGKLLVEGKDYEVINQEVSPSDKAEVCKTSIAGLIPAISSADKNKNNGT